MTALRQGTFDFKVRAELGRNDFLVAAANADAMRWIEGWRDWPAPALTIWGPSGCGKTHLLSVFREATGARPLDIRTMATQAAGGLFTLDDADRVVGSAEEEGLFHFYNRLKTAGGALLVAAARPPNRWPIRLMDLRSRLNAAPVVAVAPPDDGLLAAVLIKLLADRQLRVGKNVFDYVLPRLERTYAAVVDLVVALDRRALSEGREITVPLVRQVLAAMDTTADGDARADVNKAPGGGRDIRD